MANWWRRDRDAEIREELDTHVALETERLIDERPGSTRGPRRRDRKLSAIPFAIARTPAPHTAWSGGITCRTTPSRLTRHQAAARRRRRGDVGVRCRHRRPGGCAVAPALHIDARAAWRDRPDELVMLWETPPQVPGSRRDATLETYDVWRRHATCFRGSAAPACRCGCSSTTRSAGARPRPDHGRRTARRCWAWLPSAAARSRRETPNPVPMQ